MEVSAGKKGGKRKKMRWVDRKTRTVKWRWNDKMKRAPEDEQRQTYTCCDITRSLSSAHSYSLTRVSSVLSCGWCDGICFLRPWPPGFNRKKIKVLGWESVSTNQRPWCSAGKRIDVTWYLCVVSLSEGNVQLMTNGHSSCRVFSNVFGELKALVHISKSASSPNSRRQKCAGWRGSRQRLAVQQVFLLKAYWRPKKGCVTLNYRRQLMPWNTVPLCCGEEGA